MTALPFFLGTQFCRVVVLRDRWNRAFGVTGLRGPNWAPGLSFIRQEALRALSPRPVNRFSSLHLLPSLTDSLPLQSNQTIAFIPAVPIPAIPVRCSLHRPANSVDPGLDRETARVRITSRHWTPRHWATQRQVRGTTGTTPVWRGPVDGTASPRSTGPPFGQSVFITRTPPPTLTGPRLCGGGCQCSRRLGYLTLGFLCLLRAQRLRPFQICPSLCRRHAAYWTLSRHQRSTGGRTSGN